MVDTRRRLVIVHPPKTAGTAVQQALLGHIGPITGEGVYRHDPIDVIEEKMHETQGWIAAILVRNPYERLESFYAYVTGHRWKNSDGSYTHRANSAAVKILESGSFQAFVEADAFQWYFDRPYEDLGLWLQPMTRYACEQELRAIHYENLEVELEQLTGEKIKLERVRVSGREPQEWTAKMRAIVNDAFQNDFRTYGYEAK